MFLKHKLIFKYMKYIYILIRKITVLQKTLTLKLMGHSHGLEVYSPSFGFSPAFPCNITWCDSMNLKNDEKGKLRRLQELALFVKCNNIHLKCRESILIETYLETKPGAKLLKLTLGSLEKWLSSTFHTAFGSRCVGLHAISNCSNPHLGNCFAPLHVRTH